MLSPEQSDALTEVINIGFSRAASSFSELTGHRVLLDPPHVAIYPIAELGDALKSIISGDIATVHQIFSGPVAGDAMPILSHDDATLLARLLTDDQRRSRTLDVSDRHTAPEWSLRCQGRWAARPRHRWAYLPRPHRLVRATNTKREASRARIDRPVCGCFTYPTRGCILGSYVAPVRLAPAACRRRPHPRRA